MRNLRENEVITSSDRNLECDIVNVDTPVFTGFNDAGKYYYDEFVIPKGKRLKKIFKGTPLYASQYQCVSK